MKLSAFLVNVARGAMVQNEALFDALRRKQIAGAAFDTFWSEPSYPHDPILNVPGLFLPPDVAGFTDVSVDHVIDLVVHNVRCLVAGAPLVNVVPAP